MYLFAVVVFIFAVIFYRRKNEKFPRGPTGVPFLGALPFIGKRPEVAMKVCRMPLLAMQYAFFYLLNAVKDEL